MVRTLLKVVWEDDYCRKPSYRYNADDDDVGSDIGEDNDKALKSIMSTLMMMSMTVKTSMMMSKTAKTSMMMSMTAKTSMIMSMTVKTSMMMSMTVKTSMIVKKVSAIGSSSGQGRCEGRFFIGCHKVVLPSTTSSSISSLSSSSRDDDVSIS